MELVESVDESFASHPLIRIAHAHAVWVTKRTGLPPSPRNA